MTSVSPSTMPLHMLSVPVTVMVPETTSQSARELLALEAAEVVVPNASRNGPRSLMTPLRRLNLGGLSYLTR